MNDSSSHEDIRGGGSLHRKAEEAGESTDPWTRALGAKAGDGLRMKNATEERNRTAEDKGYEFLGIVRKGIQPFQAENSVNVIVQVGDKWLVYSENPRPAQPRVYEVRADAEADLYERECQDEELKSQRH